MEFNTTSNAFNGGSSTVPADSLEQFIAGELNEDQFLREVVTYGRINEGRIDTERMLNRVEVIQGELNARLRQGVEQNYPRLLEQASAIETLDSAHLIFHNEMDTVAKQAIHLADTLNKQVSLIRTNVLAISNLTRFRRLLGDAIRCEDLANNWRDEKDLLKRVDFIARFNTIVKSNEKLKQLKWLQERCLFKRDETILYARQNLLDQLRASLRSQNANVVNATMNAMYQLLDSPNIYQSELALVMEEAVKELDSMFLQLSAQSNQDRVAKLLPQLGSKLHVQLEQFQLLGIENAQQFSRKIAKVITNRVPTNAFYAMRLVQTIYRSVLTHPEPVSNVIRDSLNPLKASILSQSLSNLFKVIDEILDQQDRDAIFIEKLNAALRAKLASVSWDKTLQEEMKINVAKALQYIAVKIEQKVQFGEETLRFIGRISKTQNQNYQLLNVAYELTRHWPTHCTPLNTVIQTALQTILDQMRSTVLLVLASMHDENMHCSLPITASSSDYVKELCAHLKVFRQHCLQLKPLNDSLDVLPSFLNFCIEQFLLHISLIRPIETESINRFVHDLEFLCKNGLQIYNCKYAKLLNSYKQIEQFIFLLPNNFTELSQLDELSHQPKHEIQKSCSPSLVIPQWFVAHMVICACDPELHLPHDSAGWTISNYIEWFNEHSDQERWRFLRGLLDAYKQSIVAKGGTKFVPQFPLLNQIINNNLYNIAA